MLPGIDFVKKAIVEAKNKTNEWGLQTHFLVMDVLHLDQIPEVFDSVIDCGLSHCLADEDQAKYVEALASAVKPGSKLLLACFSDKEPPGDGPRGSRRRKSTMRS